jgi:hypothetical protein
MKYQGLTEEEKTAILEAVPKILSEQLRPNLVVAMGHIETLISNAVKASDRSILTELRKVLRMSQTGPSNVPTWEALESLIERLEEGL